MGREREVRYYNGLFIESEEYKLHYRESLYYVLWTQIIQFLKNIKEPRILELGCGSGQFAHYLYDEGFKEYKGFDFSPVAVNCAKKTVNQSFFKGNALDIVNYQYDYNVVVALEIIEHIKDEFTLIKNIKTGSPFIFSLPTFNDPSHVRWFHSQRQIEKRYYKFLNIKKIVRIEHWFACFAVVQDYNPGFFNWVLKTRKQVTPRYLAKRVYKRIKSLIYQ